MKVIPATKTRPDRRRFLPSRETRESPSREAQAFYEAQQAAFSSLRAEVRATLDPDQG